MGTGARDTVTGFGDVVAELKASLDGEVLAGGDAGHADASKVWNGMYDERRPVAVLRPISEEDVRRAVAVLAEVDAPLAIRGGGHHIAGFGGCDGGTKPSSFIPRLKPISARISLISFKDLRPKFLVLSISVSVFWTSS